MASFRMIAKSTVSSDRFLDLPPTAQLLYFHIALNADDDGFTDCINTIRKMVGVSKNDIDTLIKAGYIHVFETGVAVDMYWHANNTIRKDRYKPTVYQKEYQQLELVDGGIYVLKPTDNQVSTICQPTDNQVSAQIKEIKEIKEIRLDKINPTNEQSTSNNNSADNNINNNISREANQNENEVNDNAQPSAEPEPGKSLDGMDLYSLDNKNAFELFRKEYPRRQGALRDVQTAWVNATIADHVLPGDLVMAARNYAARCKREKVDPKYIKMPQNFIKDGWREYIPKHLPSCPHCHGQGVYEGDNGMILCDCDRRYG